MQSQALIERFNATLPEQERTLEQAARNVKLGLERDSEIYKAFTQLHFFTLTVDFDMRVMLRALLVDPQNRLTAEKFLALTLEEAEGAVGRMIGTLIKNMRTLPDDSGAGLFDHDKINDAVREFKANMAEMRDSVEFNKTLRLIRNTVSGHIVGDDTGVQNSVIWVLTREGVARTTEGVLKSQIVYFAVSVLTALDTLSRGLQLSLVKA
ncbi:hypothetical protein E3T43_00925 [Cryobacterium sp. Hh7]|uniref:hypothetical protein n=1 Tax=Cryobacterium sp. Hh7 TaxID=1259159 RepID=UPI0010690197|nr:hypothetical protein [Cryobacterium sp. Hh7]TFD61189.1 hypothetical protein E3T43_00925 [Cryobacterium sp. Hh7]